MDVFISSSTCANWQAAADVLAGVVERLPERLPPQPTYAPIHPSLLTRWRNLRDDIKRVGRIFIVTEGRRRRVVFHLPDTVEGRKLGQDVRQCGPRFTEWVAQ